MVANTLRAAEDLAAALHEDDLVEVVRADTLRPGYRPDQAADVVIALSVVPPAMPPSSPKIVLVSKNGPLQRNNSVRASLRLDALPGEIAAAAVAAHAGLYALTSDQLQALPDAADHERRVHEYSIVEERLTPREVEVLRMMADGASNKEIGAELGISNNTAKYHVAQVLAKLGAGSRAEAVRVGIQRGLVLL